MRKRVAANPTAATTPRTVKQQEQTKLDGPKHHRQQNLKLTPKQQQVAKTTRVNGNNVKVATTATAAAADAKLVPEAEAAGSLLARQPAKAAAAATT